jgi:hypothetical protein
MTDPITDIRTAMSLLRKPGAKMTRTNLRSRSEFWIRDERVAPDVALKIINDPRVVGSNDSLLFGCHQTWTLK